MHGKVKSSVFAVTLLSFTLDVLGEFRGFSAYISKSSPHLTTFKRSFKE